MELLGFLLLIALLHQPTRKRLDRAWKALFDDEESDGDQDRR